MKSAAIIGCGRIAWKLEEDKLRYKPCTHAGALLHFPRDLRVIGVCDRNAEKSEDLAGFLKNRAKAGGDTLITADHRQVLTLHPDIAVIASSTESHFKILSDALKAGIPHIITEKPVCTEAAQARQLLKLAAKSPSRVHVNYERRRHDSYIRLKQLIRDGVHGRVLRYSAVISLADKLLFAGKTSEGILLRDTTHLLDVAMYFFGGVSSHRSVANEKVHHLILRHGDIPGEISSSAATPFFAFEFTVWFENAVITVGNGYVETRKAEKSPHYEGFRSLSAPKSVRTPAPTVTNNPFVRLVRECLEDTDSGTEFTEACQNIIILAGKSDRIR